MMVGHCGCGRAKWVLIQSKVGFTLCKSHKQSYSDAMSIKQIKKRHEHQTILLVYVTFFLVSVSACFFFYRQLITNCPTEFLKQDKL